MSEHDEFETIVAFYREWFDAMSRGDVDGVLGLLEEEFYLKGPNQPPATDKKILRKELKRVHRHYSETTEWEIEEYVLFDTAAVVRVAETATLVSRKGRERTRIEGVHLSLLARQPGGGWRLQSDVSSLNHPPPNPG